MMINQFMLQALGESSEMTEEEGGRKAASLSPRHRTAGSSHSSGGESSDNVSCCNEKSELSTSSCMTRSSSSSIKESDDMSPPDMDAGADIGVDEVKDKVFVPVTKSAAAGRGKLPFWLESLSNTEHTPSWLYRDNMTSNALEDFPRSVIPQPEGVLLQLQELVSELQLGEDSSSSLQETEEEFKKMDYTVEEKALLGTSVKVKENSSMYAERVVVSLL